MAVLRMFPLSSVLLPGGILPLHVFEPRYHQLVVDCLADDGDPEFGVTMIERGWEVGGGDTRANIGVVARMVQVQALDDHRYALVAVGTRRIRVETWLPDDPYPRADVDDWLDEDVHAPGLREGVEALRERLRMVLELAVHSGQLGAVPDLDVGEDPLGASYRLAELAPIGPADRYRLLAAPSPGQRLEELAAALDDAEAMLQFRLT